MEEPPSESDEDKKTSGLMTQQSVMMIRTLPNTAIRRVMSQNRSRHSKLVKRFNKMKRELSVGKSLDNHNRQRLDSPKSGEGDFVVIETENQKFYQTPKERKYHSAMAKNYPT